VERSTKRNDILKITIIIMGLIIGLFLDEFMITVWAEDVSTAKIDGQLLNLIDQYADKYYNPEWNLTLDQYKAWIATIAWGEGRMGGYTAHSQAGRYQKAELDGDRFDHIEVGDNFIFSTGIGPFQLDRLGETKFWPTIKKLNPKEALLYVLDWHYKNKGGGANLTDFSNNSPWLAVRPGSVEKRWKQVTGTDWNEHKSGMNKDLKWVEIVNRIKSDEPEYFYENNVRYVGEIKWDVSFVTDTGKQVSFNGYYPTWRITARSFTGQPLFSYYYTYDENVQCEVWVWDNSGQADEFRYIFVREYSTGPLPEHRTHDRAYWSKDHNYYIALAGEKKLNSPALYFVRNVDVVLVMDISGSMDDFWKGERKLDSAKKSAMAFIDIMLPPDRVAIVTFQTNAHVNLGFTSDFGSAKTMINKLDAGGDTNVGDALKKALNELETSSRADAYKAIVFFTDGHITTGMTEEEVLKGPVQEAISKKVVIYAIGYGDPSYLKEDFLRKMAEATGGKYYYATEAFELQNQFIESGLKATNWKIETIFNGTVKQGETVVAGSVYTLFGTKRLRIVLNWPGSDLDLKILDPMGKEADPSSPAIAYSGDVKPEYFMINDPLPGNWIIKVYGKFVPSEEPYKIWVATYASEGLTFYRYVPLVVIVLVLSIVCLFTWHALSLPTSYKKGLKQLKKLEALYREGKISYDLYDKLRLELKKKRE